MIELRETHIDEWSLNARFTVGPAKDLLDNAAPVLVCGDLSAMAKHGPVNLFLVLVRD